MSAACHCPTCGQLLPVDETLRIDDAGLVVRGGRYTVVPAKEMELLRLLDTHLGSFVTRRSIEAALWPGDADLPDPNVVESYVSKLRRKLAPLGLAIESATRGVGAYRLLVKRGEPA